MSHLPYWILPSPAPHLHWYQTFGMQFQNFLEGLLQKNQWLSMLELYTLIFVFNNLFLINNITNSLKALCQDRRSRQLGGNGIQTQQHVLKPVSSLCNTEYFSPVHQLWSRYLRQGSEQETGTNLTKSWPSYKRGL